MSEVFGIDLETTYSAIATPDENGLPVIIDNAFEGTRKIASVVYFPEGGNPIVGQIAREMAEIEPDRVVQFSKRELDQVDAQGWEIDGVKYDPILVTAIILKSMKEYAEEQGYNVNDVVITYPAYYGSHGHLAIKQASDIAGLNLLNVITDPTAVALDYCYHHHKGFTRKQKILVCDLGGGTFDITLLECEINDTVEATINIITTGGYHQLGGIDWDTRLYGYICDLYMNENGASQDEMDADLCLQIRNLTENVKKSLSHLTCKKFVIKHAGDATRLEVTRENFEEWTQDLVEQTINFIRQLLADAKIYSDDVDAVLLAGGSARMPMIVTAVDKMFPGKVQLYNPYLAAAKGAVLAGSLSRTASDPRCYRLI